MRITTDMFAYCAAESPRWNTISITGYHIREAGSTAVQELAFTLSNAIAYVEAALDAGLEVDEFAPRLSFFFNAHNDLFQEVAKYRAARRMWATIMRDRFGASDERSLKLRFHTQTAGSSLTAQQAENNIVRTTVQALSAVLGGTQSLHTNAFDEALALPTEQSARIALRTQQILASEGGLTGTADPLAGSYYVESLTDAVEEEAWAYIRRIDELGGSVKAIEERFMQREIEDAAYRYQREVEREERVIVGVNRYTSGGTDDPGMELHTVDETIRERQKERLADLKESRDNAAVEKALAALEGGSRGLREPSLPDERGPGRARDAGRGLRHPPRGLRRVQAFLRAMCGRIGSSAQRHQAAGVRLQDVGQDLPSSANGSMGAYGVC